MYKLLKNKFTNQIESVQTVNGDTITSIPFDTANADYQVYLKWLDGYEAQFNSQTHQIDWIKTSDGNTPLPADE
jgi:hypothetical protein